MVDPQWFALDVNPYPWKVPPISVGRKGGKVYPVVGRDTGLHTYKEAIKEQLAHYPTELIVGPVALYTWYWRNIPEYETPQGRRARKHEADTTNLQKATEDALQGILYANDKDVDFVQSYRVMQGPLVPGMLVICATPFAPMNTLLEFPDAIKFAIAEMLNRGAVDASANDYETDEEVPF